MAENDRTERGMGSALSPAQVQSGIKKALMKRIMDSGEPLKEIMTEQEVLDMLGFKKDFLDRLRRRFGFPFCKVSHQRRFYLTRDIAQFIADKRVVMNIMDD